MNILILFLFFFVVSAHPVQAYIDPGAGSYILQLLVGSMFGAIFVIKKYWSLIKVMFIWLISHFLLVNHEKSEEKKL